VVIAAGTLDSITDVPQRAYISQLHKHHGYKMRPGINPFTVLVCVMFPNYFVKFGSVNQT